MRLIFRAIVLLDIVVLLAGVFFIFDAIMKKKSKKKEFHYTFRPFQKETKRGYALYNDNKQYIYYTIKEKENDKCSIYSFKNCLTKKIANHRVSALLKSKNSPNFSNRSFFFDDKEIWKYLENNGIGIRATLVNDSLTQYMIEKGQKTIAFIRKRKGSGRVYTMRTYEKNIDLLFLVLFAIAKTNE